MSIEMTFSPEEFFGGPTGVPDTYIRIGTVYFRSITCHSVEWKNSKLDDCQKFKLIWFFFSFSGHSQELHNMLCNRHLREMIREIDSSKDPGKLLGQAMQIPIFTEFADECLRIVEPQDESEMVHWDIWLVWVKDTNPPSFQATHVIGDTSAILQQNEGDHHSTMQFL